MADETPTITPLPADVPDDGPGLEPPKRAHTSFSQLDLYKRCSLRYYLKYIRKLPERPALNLARGKAGHQALETDHRVKIKTGENISTEQLLDTFSDAYDAFTHELEPSDLEPGEDIGKNKDATAATLHFYSIKVGPKIQPRLVEWEFNLDLAPTEDYPEPIRIVNGRIDLLDASGIYDNKFPKSSRGVKSQTAVDLSWQLTLYDEVFSSQLNLEVPSLGLIQFVPPDTKNGAVVKTVRRSDEEMEPAQRERRRARLRHVIRETERSIKAGIYMPADDPLTCSYCPYRTQCQSSLAKDDFATMSVR